MTVSLVPVASVQITPNTLAVAVGDTGILRAQARDQAGNVLTGRTVTWTTDNLTIATVTSGGLVSGVAVGTATITATSEGKSASATATVSPARVASVSVSPASLFLFSGQTATVQAQPLDRFGKPLTGRTLTWASSSPSVATVSATGLVTGVAPGAATVSATSEGKAGSVPVTVGGAPFVTVGPWTPVGPHHIDSGQGLLSSGKLQALAVFPGNQIMYTGGGLGSGNEGPWTEAGVFRTSDGGAHWTPLNSGLTDPVVNSLWVSPRDSNTVLAATEFTGIFRSTDGGRTWSLTGSFPSVNGAATEFAADGTQLLAATSVGIVQSADQGSTWSIVYPTGSRPRAIGSAAGVAVAALEDGTLLLRASPAAGWHQSGLVAGKGGWAVAVDDVHPGTAFVLLGAHPSTLVATFNAGATWSTLNPPVSAQAVLIPPGSDSLYMAAGGSLYVSVDHGTTWKSIPNAGWDNRRIFSLPGRGLILGSDQGLRQTTDAGKTWTDLSGSLYTSILTSVSVRGSTIVTGVQDFSPILSFDGGLTWKHLFAISASPPAGEDGPVLINPADPSYCYAYTTAGYQYSIDGCHTFHPTSTAGLAGLTYVQPGGADIIAVDPSTPARVYAAAQGGIFRSTDYGVTMAPTGWPITSPTALAVDPADGRRIYVATTTQLLRTTDGGASWTQLSLGGAIGYPSTIAIDPQNPQVVLVGTTFPPAYGGGVFRSRDGGNTFQPVNSGLGLTIRNAGVGVEMLSLRFNPNAILALASKAGIYVSADLGDHWQDVSANAIPRYFSDVAWDGNYLYTATFGQGVLRAPVSLSPSSVVVGRRARK